MTFSKSARLKNPPIPLWASFKNLLPPEGQKYAVYYLLIIAVLVAYRNIYDNAFLFDDEFLIINNEYLRHWSSLGKILTSQTTAGADTYGSFYRPLQNLLYLIVYQFSGLSLPQYHLLNVFLHVANACLVYRLGCKLGFKSFMAFLAALIWALHPLQVEAVTYISATADPLYTLFCLLGVMAVLPDFTRRKILMACPILVLALLSKETAVVFPLLVMSCMFLLSKERLKPVLYLRTWPFWLIIILYVAARPLLLHLNDFQFFDRPQMVYQLYRGHVYYRLLTCFATLPSYLGLLAWPTHLHMDRDFPVYLHFWYPETLAGAGLVALAFGQIMSTFSRLRKANETSIKDGLAVSWALLWFAAAHLLHTGILVPVNSLFLEHWMYLPSVGLFLGLGQAIQLQFERPQLQKYKFTATTLTLAIAGLLGFLTYHQNATWINPDVFYNRILSYGETSARAHNNLGNYYSSEENYEQALEQYRLGLKTADTHPEIHLNIALLLLKLPPQAAHINEAIDELKRSIEIDPNYYSSYEALAEIYAYQKDDKKESYYRNRAEEIRKKLIH